MIAHYHIKLTMSINYDSIEQEIIANAIIGALKEIKYNKISNLLNIVCLIKPYQNSDTTLDEY